MRSIALQLRHNIFFLHFVLVVVVDDDDDNDQYLKSRQSFMILAIDLQIDFFSIDRKQTPYCTMKFSSMVIF
jgi:hypothetical protein